MEDGWVEYVDPATGHPYLYHAESGESRWVEAAAAGARGQPGRPRERRVVRRRRATAEAEAASSSSSSSSSSDDDERGISDDEFDDPDLEAKFRRMLETPEGREAVRRGARARGAARRPARARAVRRVAAAAAAAAEAVVAVSCRRWRRCDAAPVPFGVIRWGWNRWRRPEAAGDRSALCVTWRL